MEKLSNPKEPHRKTANKEKVAPKPPEKKAIPKTAKSILGPSGLAKKKHGELESPRKSSRAAKIAAAAVVAGGILLGAEAAEAKAPEREERFSTPSYLIAPPLVEGSSVESISYLLSTHKAETEKYLKSRTLNIFDVSVPQGKLRLQLDTLGQAIKFTVSGPGMEGRSFEVSFSELNLMKPQLRIQDKGEYLIIRLLDSEGGRHVRITALKHDVSPAKMAIRIFDEMSDSIMARQVFQSLSNLPEIFVSPEKKESKAFMEALRAAEETLVSKTRDLEFSRSDGDKRTAFERTIDTFISIYSSMGGEAADRLSAAMEGMSREERKKAIDFFIPRFTAIMLRPYAAWEGRLGQLDRCCSGRDFDLNALRDFAWHNNLHQEYNFLLKSLRERLSS